MNSLLARLKPYPFTSQIVASVLDCLPDHAGYLEKSFQNRPASTRALAEESARLIDRIKSGGYERLARGYEWLCEMIKGEELFFRRNGRYRNSSFAEIDAAVYQNHAAMSTYMDGLLATEVLWVQHARAMDFYVNTYLTKLKEGFRHLEIGPGHGLLLHYPAVDPRCRSLCGWDISPASLEQTAACLKILGVDRRVNLETRDIMMPPGDAEPWDSLVVSEVLEHLEDPAQALRNLRDCLSPEGFLYVNVPVNAPTIDHIHLFRTPEEAVTMVERAGFTVDEMLFAPGAGYTLEKARKREASITVALVARRSD